MAKRIIEYPEATDIAVDDYVVVGSAIFGTRKLLASKLSSTNNLITITESNYQALSTADKNNGKVYFVEGSPGHFYYMSDRYDLTT